MTESLSFAYSFGAMKVTIREEDEARRQRLADIYSHVGEIANKIAVMDDPLPGQLQRSIPDYQETLKCHANKLKHSTCSVAVAGKFVEFLRPINS